MENLKLQYTKEDALKWIVCEKDWISADESVFTTAYLREKLASVEGLEIMSCKKNDRGTYDPTYDPSLFTLPAPAYENLPAYYDIRLLYTTGKHREQIVLFVPANWNGRYLACGGGGLTAITPLGADNALNRASSPIIAIRNGLAGSMTNAGIVDPYNNDWYLDPATGKRDQELFENYAYKSFHNMAVICKQVLEILFGRKPIFSYLQGASGGGRQCLTAMQRYPEDFDGIWADCPGINWTKCLPMEVWPAVVMREYDDILSAVKLEAFREEAVKAAGGETAFYASTEKSAYRAEAVIGKKTADGVITEKDALVMQTIWDGPKDVDGSPLWIGYRPGLDMWSSFLLPMYTMNGEFTESYLWKNYIGQWVLQDRNWDWKSMTISDFTEIFKKGVRELEACAADRADVEDFARLGHKLLLTHGVCDGLLLYDGTVDYVDRVRAAIGREQADQTILFFPMPGNGHGYAKEGPTITLGEGMIALMKWVEQEIKPETLHTTIPPMTDIGLPVETDLKPYR